jgi:putative sigma-54 modulation protein
MHLVAQHMDLHVKAIGIEHTEAIDTYVEEKIGGLEKFLTKVPTPHDARIEIGKTSSHHKNGAVMMCHAHLSVPGAMLHAESDKEDLYAAIDEVKDELERQIIKYKEQRKGE